MTPAHTARGEALHTADLRIAAWAPTREQCVSEAVKAMVESFLGTGLPPPTATFESRVTGSGDGDLLAAVLSQVIRHFRAARQIPAATEVLATPTGLRVRCEMADAAGLIPVGSIPKAVSRWGSRCGHHYDGWWCSVTIDV